MDKDFKRFCAFAREAKSLGLSLRWARDIWYETTSAYYHLEQHRERQRAHAERRDRLMFEHEVNR